MPLKETGAPPRDNGVSPCGPGWYATPLWGPMPNPVRLTNSPGDTPETKVAAFRTWGERQAGALHPGSPKVIRASTAPLFPVAAASRTDPSPGNVKPVGCDSQAPRYVASANPPCAFRCTTTTSKSPPKHGCGADAVAWKPAPVLDARYTSPVVLSASRMGSGSG